MGATPVFTGASSFSKDLQNVVARAVSIASLPLNRLDADKTVLTKQSDELKTLDQKVADVRTAIDDIRDALGSSFDATVSDPAALTASPGPGAMEGNYSILVSDAGAYSTMMTTTWSDPGGAPITYKLCVGADSYDVTGVGNSAASVAAAINGSYGDKVHAVVVNAAGPADPPDYRISLQSVALTSAVLDLTNGTSLAGTQTAGRPATYEVNGSGIPVTSDSRVITIADGLNFTLLKSSASAVNVTVTRSTSALSAAVGKLVGAYNAAMKEIDGQRGIGGGPLQGDAVPAQLSSALSQIATWTTSGAFSGLRDMGVELLKDGTLSQSSWTLMAADLTNSAGVTSFFNAFAAAAGTILDGVDNPTSGILPRARSDVKSRIADLDSNIADKQSQIDSLEQRLNERMAAADALLASMEQQYSYMSSMFSAMRSASDQQK